MLLLRRIILKSGVACQRVSCAFSFCLMSAPLTKFARSTMPGKLSVAISTVISRPPIRANIHTKAASRWAKTSENYESVLSWFRQVDIKLFDVFMYIWVDNRALKLHDHALKLHGCS